MVGGSGSPLVEIEQRVLARAKDETLDLDAAGSAARLRQLLEDEVAGWSLEFKHGRRPFDLPDPALVVERAYRNLVGYGPLEALLGDEDVWEVMINGPDQIFVKRHRGVSGYHDEAFHDDEHVIRTLTKLLDDASVSHRKLDAAEGLQDAQLRYARGTRSPNLWLTVIGPSGLGEPGGRSGVRDAWQPCWPLGRSMDA